MRPPPVHSHWVQESDWLMLSGWAVEHQMKRLAFVVSPTTAIPPPTTAVTVFKSLVDATGSSQRTLS